MRLTGTFTGAINRFVYSLKYPCCDGETFQCLFEMECPFDNAVRFAFKGKTDLNGLSFVNVQIPACSVTWKYMFLESNKCHKTFFMRSCFSYSDLL